MRVIFIVLLFVFELFGSLMEAPIATLKGDVATITIDEVGVGVSGFVVKKLDATHQTILKRAVVKSYDAATKTATIFLSDFETLNQTALPSGVWEVAVGDVVSLAFGYERVLILAPSEASYYRVVKSLQNAEIVHPDIFATLLSSHGHPTPLKSDFQAFCDANAVGIIMMLLPSKLYTVECNTFKILATNDIAIDDKTEVLPFYNRLEKIDANWFGEGSERLQAYAPYYNELLQQHNEKFEK